VWRWFFASVVSLLGIAVAALLLEHTTDVRIGFIQALLASGLSGLLYVALRRFWRRLDGTDLIAASGSPPGESLDPRDQSAARRSAARRPAPRPLRWVLGAIAVASAFATEIAWHGDWTSGWAGRTLLVFAVAAAGKAAVEVSESAARRAGFDPDARPARKLGRASRMLR
jgi:hypothetical protein